MESGEGRLSYSSTAVRRPGPPPAGDGDTRPELADVGRLARRLLRQVVGAARAEENSIWHLLAGHLGPGVATLPVASGYWPQYDQVNVQAGLEAWLADPGRSHEIAGLTRFHHTMRSEEHTSELQSRRDLVCRLLLEKKKLQGKGHCSPSRVIVRDRNRHRSPAD